MVRPGTNYARVLNVLAMQDGCIVPYLALETGLSERQVRNVVQHLRAKYDCLDSSETMTMDGRTYAIYRLTGKGEWVAKEGL